MFLHLCVILITGGWLPITGHMTRGDLHPGGSALGGSASRAWADPPLHTRDTTGYGQQEGGTHPSGMHFC